MEVNREAALHECGASEGKVRGTRVLEVDAIEAFGSEAGQGECVSGLIRD